MGEPVTTGAGGKVIGGGVLAEAGTPTAKMEPIKQLITSLNLEGTAQQYEVIIRWIAERGPELIR
jgi:hypothetical protein